MTPARRLFFSLILSEDLNLLCIGQRRMVDAGAVHRGGCNVPVRYRYYAHECDWRWLA